MSTTNPITCQIRMFGCTTQEIDMAVESRKEFCSPLMMAMSILSDSQELLVMDRKEEARQYINRAKYIISNEHSKQRQAEREG